MNPRPLEISTLTKSFPTSSGVFVAIRDFRAAIAPGEFVALMGNPGCGKSVLLSVIAGMEQATEGGIILDGREISGPGLDRAVVYPEVHLLPWMSVRDNVALAVNRVHPQRSRRELEILAGHWLETVGAADWGVRMPAELPPGMPERVALAKALATEPRFLLLDDPFRRLDAGKRRELQDELQRVCEREEKTLLLATHDVDEALYLSDRVLLMTNGPESHLGLALQVPLARPRSRRVALEDPEHARMREEVVGFLAAQGAAFIHAA